MITSRVPVPHRTVHVDHALLEALDAGSLEAKRAAADALELGAELRRAGQAVLTLTYDEFNRVRTRTDATGLTLTYDYNALNQVTRVTYPDGKFENYAYSTCCPRLLDSVTDRAGRTSRFTYDALRQLIQEIDPEGGLTQYGYDANGNKIWTIDVNGNRIEGDLKASSDTASHLFIYRQRPDVHGIVHTHSPYATAFAALGVSLVALVEGSFCGVAALASFRLT